MKQAKFKKVVLWASLLGALCSVPAFAGAGVRDGGGMPPRPVPTPNEPRPDIAFQCGLRVESGQRSKILDFTLVAGDRSVRTTEDGWQDFSRIGEPTGTAPGVPSDALPLKGHEIFVNMVSSGKTDETGANHWDGLNLRLDLYHKTSGLLISNETAFPIATEELSQRVYTYGEGKPVYFILKCSKAH